MWVLFPGKPLNAKGFANLPGALNYKGHFVGTVFPVQ
jgi:hypothetical protein